MISIIIGFISNFLMIICYPYNSEVNQMLYKNWKTPPISSISYNNYLSNTNSNSNQIEGEKLTNMFNKKYLDKSYDYEHLLIEDVSDKNYHLCGIDSFGNGLYLPNKIDCPINEIEVTDNSIPSKNYFNYTSIKLCKNIYLHYSNNNIFGYIINDFNAFFSDNIKRINENGTFISRDFLLENNKAIKFVYNIYSGYSGINNALYGKRKLIFFYFTLKVKSIIYIFITINSIIYFILLIFNILILKSVKYSGLHIFIIILGLLAFFLNLIIALYCDLGYKFYDFYRIYNENIIKKYVFIFAFGAICCYMFFYIIFFGILNGTNIYYYLVYIVRFGSDSKENEFNKKKNKEEEINKLNDEIKRLNNEYKKYNEEKDVIYKKNKKTLEVLKKYTELLEKQRTISNSVNINIHIKEEIEIKETELLDLERKKKRKIDIFNELNKQINEIEKEINYYKMKKFKKLNNFE